MHASAKMTPMTAQFLTMGGGGFSMSPLGAPTELDRYLLELADVRTPLVCFAPTASADDPRYINKFLTAYGTLGVRTMVLTLWEDAGHSVERLEEADVVLVGGGHTVNLMALWDAHGVTVRLARMAAQKDVVFGGLSAGGACWFEGCITDSFGGFRPWRGGMHMLEGSFCPHFDGEADRAPVYTEAVASGDLPGGYAVDDGAAIHFVGNQVHAYVAERPGAGVRAVHPSNHPGTSGVVVEPMRVEVL